MSLGVAAPLHALGSKNYIIFFCIKFYFLIKHLYFRGVIEHELLNMAAFLFPVSCEPLGPTAVI